MSNLVIFLINISYRLQYLNTCYPVDIVWGDQVLYLIFGGDRRCTFLCLKPHASFHCISQFTSYAAILLQNQHAFSVNYYCTYSEINKNSSLIRLQDQFWLMHEREPAWNRNPHCLMWFHVFKLHFDQPSMSQRNRISKILLFGLMGRFTSKNIVIVFQGQNMVDFWKQPLIRIILSNWHIYALLDDKRTRI